jgi:predicted SAM-dependent methyltransferase
MNSPAINRFAQELGCRHVKLHLGCGGVKLRDWINIDNFEFCENDTSRSGANYDIKMDIRKLDVLDDSVDAILSVHVVEHFVRWEAVEMISHWHQKLKPNGLFITEMPDLDKCIDIYLRGGNAPQIDTPLGPINIGKTQFYGNQWSALDYETHRYVWTLAEFCEALKQVGFEILESHHEAKFHVPGRDMFVVARKRSSRRDGKETTKRATNCDINSSRMMPPPSNPSRRNEPHDERHDELVDKQSFPQGTRVSRGKKLSDGINDRAANSEAIFREIYSRGLWGSDNDSESTFYSGRGSREPKIVTPYVNAVVKFLNSFTEIPSVVDIGCGDFYVGRQIRPFCDAYVACDVLPELIEHNRHKFAELNVDFRTLDITSSRLPSADVIFVRQVLQHLSNSQIQGFLSKIGGTCKWLIVTEHLPQQTGFVPNIDHSTGQFTRLASHSGVVLTAHPFRMTVLEERKLCDVALENGVIRTIAYRLA